MTSNIYFQLTGEFNASGRNVLLASGQAVVFYRLAIMSKDGGHQRVTGLAEELLPPSVPDSGEPK